MWLERPDQPARTTMADRALVELVSSDSDEAARALALRLLGFAARDNVDVAAIANLAGNPEDLETLDAYCATGSRSSARPWAWSSPSRPDCYGPDSPSPHGANHRLRRAP